MFASKTPRDLNHDPFPFRNLDTRDPFASRWVFADAGNGRNVYDPRPEYDYAQHNEPNPVLVAFRRGRFPAGYWAHRLDKGDLPVTVTVATASQCDHARRVLTRLAALAEVSS